MIVVNLFGAPGSGKSTGAAYIFAQLKLAGVNAELVQEFAKDKVYEESAKVFQNQVYILGKQSFRLSRLEGAVDVVVVDSPVLLSCYYHKAKNSVSQEHFNAVVQDIHRNYDNMNFFVERAKPYSGAGRFQNESEANKVAEEQFKMFIPMIHELGEEINLIKGNEEGYNLIISKILRRLSN